MANLNGVAGETIGQLMTNLLNRFAPFVDKSENYYNILKALKEGENVEGIPLTLDRIQILANQEIRILPPAPAVVEPSPSGKEATKDVPPLVEPVAEEQPEVVEV